MFFILCVCVCLSIGMHTTCMQEPLEARRTHWIPRNLRQKCYEPSWVLETGLESPTRTVSGLTQWAISPVPIHDNFKAKSRKINLPSWCWTLFTCKMQESIFYTTLFTSLQVPPKMTLKYLWKSASHYIRTKNKSISRLMDKMISNKTSQVRRTVIFSSTVYSLWRREACSI